MRNAACNKQDGRCTRSSSGQLRMQAHGGGTAALRQRQTPVWVPSAPLPPRLLQTRCRAIPTLEKPASPTILPLPSPSLPGGYSNTPPSHPDQPLPPAVLASLPASADRMTPVELLPILLTIPASDVLGSFPEKVHLPPLAIAAEEVAAPATPTPVWTGFMDLLACAVLLGTYNPVLKMIFAEEHPMDPSTLTALRTFIAAAAMGVVVAIKPRPAAPSAAPSSSPDRRPLAAEPGSGIDLPLPVIGGLLAAGLELGMYLFIEVSTESVGLQLTSATRATFLTQSAAVLTPLLAYLAGERISPQLWCAVGLGLVGSLLVAYGGITSEGGAAAGLYPDELTGVLLLLTASLAISVATIRMGTLASRFCSVDLAALRQITLGVGSMIWFLSQHHPQGLGAGMPPGALLADMGIPQQSAGGWALIVFSALGPGALATYLQTKGQSTVPATAAQLIHSTTPVWSAIMAVQLGLGGESMGPMSWAGAAAVLAASVVASRSHA